MEEDYQENYLKAREVVAKELIEKYGFVESYRDNERLTLDSSRHSFHLTYSLYEGKELNVTKKGKDPIANKSFLAYVFKFTKDDLEKAKLLLAKIFEPMKNREEKYLYSTSSLIESYRIELSFLKCEFQYLFD